ncbi:trace amine-associated receptor 13c-like [Betta splendens]|uniref:Trace amine-associated receptor 13c-like n=1 Tax=Betta splendens TaxID=158456 RepID=A0A9W2XGL9_BETSP|nr:trace amine-associated receptor 13c-like [Betta splendens]
MEAQDGAELCFPQLLNASCWKPKRHQQLHTPTNLLLLSLAVSDFFVGLVVTPFGALRQTSCWYLGDLVCSLYNYVSCFVISASIGDMVLISADRYVSICDPLHYSTRVTVSRVKLCIYICWLCSFLYNSLFLKDDLTQPGRYNSCHGECLILIESISGTFDIFLSYTVPVAVIIFLYMRVFLTAVSQARAMRSHVAAVTLHHSGTKRSELKAARTLGVVVAVFLICFCPLYNGSFVKDSFDGALPETLMFTLMSINPCLNPVIYALFYPWFRKALRLIFSLQILQPGSYLTSML